MAEIQNILLELAKQRAGEMAGTYTGRESMRQEKRVARRVLEKQNRVAEVAEELAEQDKYIPIADRISAVSARKELRRLGDGFLRLLAGDFGGSIAMLKGFRGVLRHARLSKKLRDQVENFRVQAWFHVEDLLGDSVISARSAEMLRNQLDSIGYIIGIPNPAMP